ncbi:MAG: hypothetical protein JXX28_04265 [Deltaproteobacteria bacterium]|nr:hypothetical protein [Deltaproteobacteria bacterium]
MRWSSGLSAVLLLSLAARGGLAWALWDAPPLFDEQGYAAMGAGWVRALSGLAGGGMDREGLLAAWGYGRWPPLQGLLVGLGTLLGAPRLGAVAVGVATTWAVSRYGREVASERVGLVAGLVHALGPSFAFFGVSLWSEGLFALWGVLLLLAARRAEGSVRWGAATGLFAGLAALTRTAGAPFLLLLPLWLGRTRRGSGVAALAVGLALWAPWVGLNAWRTGAPLGPTGGINLAMGNNPWVETRLGSSVGDRASLDRIEEALRERPLGQGAGEAATRLAAESVAERPGAAVLRALARARVMWGPDTFLLRHLRIPVEPLLPEWLFWAALPVVWGTWAALLGGAVLGLRHARAHALPLLLVASSALGPLLTVAHTRFHLPWFTWLLPMIALGWGSRPGPRDVILAVGVLLAGWSGVGVLWGWHLGG